MTISQFVKVEWAPGDTPTEPSPTWVDITAVVQSVEVSGGRSGVFDLYGPRTATIVARNGVKSPVEAPTWGVNNFYRWLQIRVTSAAGTPLFTGYILSVEHDQSNAPFSGLVTITCTDIMGILAQAEFKPSDTIGSTVNGLTQADVLENVVQFALNLTGLSVTPTVAGSSTAFYKLPDEPSGQVLSWLQDVLGAEVGGFQIDAAGTPVVNGRWLPSTIAAATTTSTFSDTATGGEYKYLREHLTLAATDIDYYNRGVAKSSYWPTTFVAENVPSGYPKETLSRTDLPFVYSSWAEANAAMYAALYEQFITYPRSLVVYVASAHQQSTLVADLLLITNAFGTKHVVVKQTAVGDTQATYNVTVENAHHTIGTDIWKCELGFASLDRWLGAYGTGGLVILDGDSAHGWDSDAILAP